MKKHVKKLELKKNTVMVLNSNGHIWVQGGQQAYTAGELCFSQMQRVCTALSCDSCWESCNGSCGCLQ